MQGTKSPWAKNGHFGHSNFWWEKPKELDIRPALAQKLKKGREDNEGVKGKVVYMENGHKKVDGGQQDGERK